MSIVLQKHKKALENWCSSLSTKVLLLVIAIGVWVGVLQNFGIIPSAGKQVYVVGGDIDATVSGKVDVENTVSVDVGNEVEVDLQKVLGYPVGCHRSYTIEGKEYQAIDVFKSNW